MKQQRSEFGDSAQFPWYNRILAGTPRCSSWWRS
ncbi:hypothetical protein Nmel_013443 [Mimus melanotis]